MTTSPRAPISAAAPEGGASVAPPKGSGRGRRGSRFQLSARIGILVLVLGYLILPLFAMLEFSTRGAFGVRNLDAYAAILDDQNVVDGVTTSLQIAALTVAAMLVLLVPTMVWTVVRVPRMRRVVEFLCLLPLAIPAIVIVVGIAPIYRFMGQNFGAVGASPLTLALINVILVLPFAYRAIDASLRSIDTATLADAARSLGAGWPRTIIQVIVPNIRAGILSAAVLAIALVLGEYTISSLLAFNTLQVVIFLLGQQNPFVAVAVSLSALVFAFVLLAVITRFGGGSDRRHRQIVEEPAT
jgi:putative spermidine/putrescine transport system permease protein